MTVIKEQIDDSAIFKRPIWWFTQIIIIDPMNKWLHHQDFPNEIHYNHR